MNKWFYFFARLIIFGFSIYWILNDIVTCEVPTKLGSILYIIMCFIVLGLFLYFSRNQKLCNCCKKLI